MINEIIEYNGREYEVTGKYNHGEAASYDCPGESAHIEDMVVTDVISGEIIDMIDEEIEALVIETLMEEIKDDYYD